MNKEDVVELAINLPDLLSASFPSLPRPPLSRPQAVRIIVQEEFGREIHLRAVTA